MKGQKMEKKKISLKNLDRGKIVLLIAAGIILIVFSYVDSENPTEKTAEEIVTTVNVTDYAKEMEGKVEKLIDSMQGVSQVHAVITLKESEEAVVKEDVEEQEKTLEEESREETDRSVNRKTVILSKDGTDEPYVIKEICPGVRGIAVTAKGVSDVQEKQEIINMLSALFDVPVHKITIIDI